MYNLLMGWSSDIETQALLVLSMRRLLYEKVMRANIPRAGEGWEQGDVFYFKTGMNGGNGYETRAKYPTLQLLLDKRVSGLFSEIGTYMASQSSCL